MENLKNNTDEKIPKIKRIKNKDEIGKEDEDGFFRTPNGSFWDMDGEYFNRYGYDIHGGFYKDGLDYIPGPTWLDDLGCYPEDKEKYLQEDKFDVEDDNNIVGEDNFDFNAEIEEIKKENNKKNKKKNKKKKKEEEDDEWEEIEDE